CMLTACKIVVFVSAVIASAGLVLACSSSSSSSSSSSGSSGTPGEGGADGGGGGMEAGAGDSGGGDAAPVVVNDCKTFTDKTAGARTITWSFPLSNADRCWTIKTGQDVTFNGDFTM